mgnify:CR=1 FL=1
MLVDDSGYRFDDPEASKAILKGTSFDEDAEDARARTKGRDDGSHGAIRLDGFGFESTSVVPPDESCRRIGLECRGVVR